MKRWRVPLILALCFAGRLLFGLSREFFFEDETQIFLIGFRYHATAAWPFFGPDVVWTRSKGCWSACRCGCCRFPNRPTCC
jgi:hypothetical protein